MDVYGAYHWLSLSWFPGPYTPLAEFARRWLGRCPNFAEVRVEAQDDKLGPIAERALNEVGRRGLQVELSVPEPHPSTLGDCAINRLVRERANRLRPVHLEGLRPAVNESGVVLLPSAPCPALGDFMRAAGRRLFGETDAAATRPRFQIRLSGPVDDMTAARLLRRLEMLAEPASFGRLKVEDICLVGDPGLGRHIAQLRSFAVARAPRPTLPEREPTGFDIMDMPSLRGPIGPPVDGPYA